MLALFVMLALHYICFKYLDPIRRAIIQVNDMAKRLIINILVILWTDISKTDHFRKLSDISYQSCKQDMLFMHNMQKDCIIENNSSKMVFCYKDTLVNRNWSILVT